MLVKHLGSLLIATNLPRLCMSSPTKRDITVADAQSAYGVLQQWYDQGAGTYRTTGWWNSARCTDVIGHLAVVDASKKGEITAVLSNTFTKAGGGSFLNGYYDDEGWWALAWIQAYDLTRDAKYLNMAERIYDDMYKVFGKTSCSQNKGGTGGIWWDKKQTYVNAIANGLFLSLAAHLATRVSGDRKAGYTDTAKKQWNWFKNTALFNNRGTINDGLINGCKSNEEYQATVWSYNQGVAVGGLAELAKATGDSSYITSARGIADATMAQLAPNGILVDICERNSSCNGDQTQFKGVFARSLATLHKASPQPGGKYAAFLHNNANSIWSNDRNNAAQLSVRWGGPFMNPANASTQSSALDCLVASLST